MKKNNSKQFILVIVVLVLAAMGYYIYLSNREKEQKSVTSMTEEQKLLQYDLDNDYPKTVRETVNLHCRYLKSAYNQKFEESDLPTVNKQIRKLFDEDLLAYNPEDEQLQGLKQDIASYAKKKQKFSGYSLEESSQIQYNTEDGRDYAKTTVTLSVTVGSTIETADQEYLLRKDSEGKWKILGWQTVQPDKKEE